MFVGSSLTDGSNELAGRNTADIYNHSIVFILTNIITDLVMQFPKTVIISPSQVR